MPYVGDSHKGPLIIGENPLFEKIIKHKRIHREPQKTRYVWSQPKVERPTAQINHNGPPTDRPRYPSGDSLPRSRA
jgi:hypothetical protein